MNSKAFCFAVSLLLMSPLSAEDLWVTDMLQLELYQTANMNGTPIRRLKSGDRLTVISRDNRYANVRAEDGVTGWVKSLYLVDKAPARARIDSVEQQNDKLSRSVESLQAQLNEEQAKYKKLQETASEEELQRLRDENEAMLQQLALYSSSVPLSWLLGALLVVGSAGFAGGWYWVDSRSRAKHGGYRVY